MKFPLLGAVAAVALAMPADAAMLLYTLTGATADKWTASFTLDTSRTPSIVIPGNYGSVRYNGVPVSFTRPNSSVVETASLTNTGPTFQTLGNQGGFYLGNLGGFPIGFSVYGPQLFSGTPATGTAPTFLTGAFGLSDVSRQRTTDPLQVNYTLTVTDVTAGAVPEPATWAVVTIGFGLTGAALRRRGRTIAIA